jgi:ankyrin repeat protein
MPDRPEQPTAAGNNKPLTKEQLDVLNEQLAYAAKFGEFKTIKSCLEQGADVNAGPYLNRTPLWSTVFYDRLGSHEIVQFLLERGADVESRDSDGETPLWRASAEGNEKNVQLLLNSKAQVNVRDNYGNPAVFQAIRNDRREIIPILIKAGADIDDKNEDGETSLWKAAKDGDEDKVSMLLEWGADVNATNHAGSSVLSAAAASSNDTIVRLLLDASTSFDKPDIELEDDNGLTALWRALENKATVCSALLIEEGANIRVRDKNSGSIVFIAAASGNESILRSLLLDDKEDIESKDEYGRTVLRHVLSSGDHKCIDLVLGLKPKIDLKVVEGSSTLHEATRAGSHTAINYLLDGKDPTARTDDLDGKGHTPLWLALSTRNQLCIDLLWQQDPDLKKDIKDGSLLHQAARFGNSKAIELLLREELHTESTDDYGRTPLWLAVNARDEPCVKILLGATEDIDTQDKNGVSILHQAVKKKELKIVKMLLNGPEDGKSSIPGASAETESESMVERATVSKFKHRKPSIDTKDNHGDWPLGQAFADHSYDIADALLLAGAAVETTNENGQTVLWQAVTRVDLVAVARLLNAKANVNAKSPSNVSVLHQAVIEDNVDLVRLLLGESTATVDATTELVHPDGKVKISPLVETTQPPSQIAAARISPDVNTTDTAGESPLLAAVNNKSMEIVKLLLKQKLKFDGVDPQGDSELAQAAYQGSAEMVEELLKAGADAKKANRDGWTPLHWAVRRSHAGVWDKLLDHNADIFAVNEYGKTPVHIAVDNGHVSFIELLESRSKAIKRQPIAQKGKARSTNFLDTQFADGETILHMAAAGRKLDVLNFLLASNVNISATTKKGETALHVAVEVVFFKGVKRLLSKMDAISIGLMNCNGDTALHLACRDDRKDMVKGILAKISTTGRDTAAKKNNTNETPLSISVENESLDVLLLLVNFEADVKYIEEDEHLLKLAKAEGQPNSKSAAKSDVQSLRWATMEDPLDDIDAQAAGELLDNEDIWKDELEDEDIKGEKRENRTKTLYWASRNGYKPLVEKILRAEEVDLGNALYWAAVGNKIKIVEFLFATYKHSPAIRSESVAGKAIQAAARNGHQTIVQYLIKNLIKTDGKTFSRGKAKDSYTDTWTPLHWAIDYQYKGNDDLDIVRNMLMNGADPEKMETGIGAESATSLVKSMCDIFSKKDYDTILGLLESPLRIPPKPISLVDPAVGHPAAAEFICKSFSANIVDFYTADGRFFTLERKKSIHDIIYDRDGGPDYLMDHAKTSWNLDDIVLEDRLRWIHLPANNVSAYIASAH